MLKIITAVSCACVAIEMASMQPVAAENVPPQLVATWLAEDIGGGGVIDNLQSTLEIREDGTVYYLGLFSISNMDTQTFDHAIRPRDSEQPFRLRFSQQFFVD